MQLERRHPVPPGAPAATVARRFLDDRRRRRAVGYAVAVLGPVLLGLALLVTDRPVEMVSGAWLLAFVAVAAWLGGLGPALASIASCTALLVTWLLTDGDHALDGRGLSGLVAFLVVAAGAAALTASTEAARARAQRAHDDLVRSRSHLDRLAQLGGVGVISGDEHAVREANDAFLGMVGASREQLERGELRWRDLVPPQEGADDQAAFRELLRDGSTRPGHLELLHADGHRVPVLVAGALLERRPLRWVCFVADLAARREAEERLRGSEQRYRSLVEATGAIVWHLDAKGRTRVSSVHGWEDFTGRPRLDGLGPGWLESFHPDDRRAVGEGWRHGMAQGRAFEVTARLWHGPSDDHRWVVLRGVPVDDGTAADEAPGAATDEADREATEPTPGATGREWVGTVEDVHDVRQAQHAAAESAALLDTLLRDAPIGFAFVDRDLRFRVLNATIAELSGGRVEDLVGRPAADTVPGLAGAAEALMRGVIASGEPVLGLELRGASAFGAPTDRDWLINFYPVRDHSGEVAGLGVTLIDLTERSRLEAAVREAEAVRATAALAERLEEAQRIARTGSWEWDVRTNELTWSREMYRLYGLPVGGPNPPLATGTGHIHPDDLPRVLAQYEQLASTPPTAERGFAFEHRLLLPDGAQRDVAVSGEVVVGPDGRTRTIRGTSQDVTEQRQAERALRRARDELLQAEVRRQQEHRTIEALQRAAIPGQLPAVPGFELAATYDPAGVEQDVGGDWYDVLLLDDRHLLCVVGDVSGHGLDAATIMVQLRNALRAYVVDGAGPGESLAALNRLLERLGTGSFATAVVAVLDTATGEVRWSHAGHPPMLRFGPDSVTVLDEQAAGGPLLGVVPDATYAEDTFVLAAGEGLLAFTDGLVERRGEHIDRGLERLADTLWSLTVGAAAASGATDAGTGGDHHAGHRPLSSVCHELAAALFAGEVRQDDVCQLVLRRRPAPPRRHVSSRDETGRDDTVRDDDEEGTCPEAPAATSGA